MALGPKATAFLAAFRDSGRVSHACQTTGCSRSTHNRMLSTNPEYADLFERAQAERGSMYEDEAHRRGVEGTLKDVWFKGEICGQEREYSDACLLALLRGTLPKYNAKRGDVAITVPKGARVVVDTYNINQLSESELKALLAITRKLSRTEIPDPRPA
jgi:hypothetical protein